MQRSWQKSSSSSTRSETPARWRHAPCFWIDPILLTRGVCTSLALNPERWQTRYTGWSTVAEINWRGRPGTTYVQWARVIGLSTRGDVPVLELADDILEGASGGGVWAATADGVLHVGNSWLRRVDSNGSVAALNPAWQPTGN